MRDQFLEFGIPVGRSRSCGNFFDRLFGNRFFLKRFFLRHPFLCRLLFERDLVECGFRTGLRLRCWSRGERRLIFGAQSVEESLIFGQCFQLGHRGQSLQAHGVLQVEPDLLHGFPNQIRLSETNWRSNHDGRLRGCWRFNWSRSLYLCRFFGQRAFPLLGEVDFALLCGNPLFFLRRGSPDGLDGKFAGCLSWPRCRKLNFGRRGVGGRRPRTLLIPRCQLSVAAGLLSVASFGIDFFQGAATNRCLPKASGTGM